MCDIDKLDIIEEFISLLDMKQDIVQLEETKETENPLNKEEKCCLINSKKESYYKYTYNPTNIIKNIKDTYKLYNEQIIEEDKKIKFNDFYTSYMDNINKIINTDKKEKCCNCISFTLYVIDNTCKDFLCHDNQRNFFEVIDKLYGYLSSLEISVINIEKNLKNFISRIYLDFSIIKFFVDISKIDKNMFINPKYFTYRKNRIEEILKFLYNNLSVEIYTYMCKSYESEIEKTRSLRFLPLLDENVNIKIIREADGIVSCLDCINIDKFEKSNKLMITYNLLDLNNFLHVDFTEFIKKYLDNISDDISNKMPGGINLTPYSEWLRLYCGMNKYMIENNIQIFNILAGDIGFSFQVKKKYYEDTFNIFKQNYNELIKMFSFSKAVKVGYDEMLLYELFKELNSIKIIGDIGNIKISDFNIYDVILVLNNIFYPKIHLKIDTYDVLNKIKAQESIDYEKMNPDYELDFIEYVLDSNLKNLLKENIINTDENILSVNKILSFLNQMPKQLKIETFVLDLYKNSLIYNDKEKLQKKYLKYKQKYIQIKKDLN